MKKKALLARGIAAIMALLLFLTVTASTLMFQFAGVINQALGVSTTKIVMTDNNLENNSAYYDSEFGTDYANKQSALMLELAAATENVLQAEEGTVLMKNDNAALPLMEGNRITIFGNGSFYSNAAESTVESIPTMTFNTSMQKVLGDTNVNLTLAEKVYCNLQKSSNSEIVEAPIEEVKAYESTWKNDYNDAAVVVLTRVGGEDTDTSMYAADGTPFLDLQPNEKELLSYLAEQKEAGVFKKIILVLNTEHMMELGWLDDYSVDACVLAGMPGAVGFEGVANVISGKVNPSGKTVDTYAVSSFSAPAVTYAVDHTQVWGNVDEVNANCADATNGGREVDSYVIYAEGIYVGYKYYETRYEDCVMGTGSADSAVGVTTGQKWNYNDEVVFTFGHGLSYTTFEQELLNVSYNGSTDKYEVDVKVTNTGEVAGKSVVEVYAQTPYGEYEKENLIEKSAVSIVGFAKTQELEPNASETVTVEVERYMLASYDENKERGYILSAGDYYLSIGDNAHDALNNILSAKGYTVSDGMDDAGDAGKTYGWNQEEIDTSSYAFSRYTQEEVTNQFDYADLNDYGVEFTYLSRSDWNATYPEKAVVVEATDEMIEDLGLDWYETPNDAPSVSSFTQGADNGLSFVDMRLTDYDDENWDLFLDQLSVDEMTRLTADTFGAAGIDNVNLPAQVRADDNLSAGTMIATGQEALSWVSEPMTARTWNTERFSERGRYLALESAFCGMNEIWYGGGNIHRTPFGGRNAQYCSEDGNFGYIVTSHEAKAMQDNGITYCIKHFALNDQETSRESLSTFATEQAIREEYLRVFEGAICEGGALGVMASFNRVGVIYAAVNKELLTSVLRNEWGFKGHVTTDGFSSASSYKTHFSEMIAAGIDYLCLDPGETGAAVKAAIDSGDGYMMECLRRTAKNNIYVASRSTSVNGLSSNSVVITVVPWWEITMLIATAVFAAGFVVCVVLMVLLGRNHKQKMEEGRNLR